MNGPGSLASFGWPYRHRPQVGICLLLNTPRTSSRQGWYRLSIPSNGGLSNSTKSSCGSRIAQTKSAKGPPVNGGCAEGLLTGQRLAETQTECSSRVTGKALWTARGARVVRFALTLCQVV
jgi:hypothetical protein